MTNRVTVTVSGRVQGVGFRAWTVAEVKHLRLPVTGTVRNTAGGDVEVVAESEDRKALEFLVERLAIGPGPSRVDSVDPQYEIDDKPRYTDFVVDY